jgi:MFS family permease
MTREQRRAVSLLGLALVLAMTTWFSATAVIPQLRAEWGLSSGAAAWLTIAVQLGFVAGALVSAVTNLADIFSPTKVIMAGAFGAAIVNALLIGVSGPALAIPLRFATGFFIAGIYPPALKLMATWFGTGRGRALGILVGGLTLGSAAPHLINGLGGLEWRAVVVTTSLLTVAGGFIAATLVGEGPQPFPRARFDPRQLGRVFADRGVRLASLGYLGHMWELYAMWAWFLLFFSASLTESASTSRSAAYATFSVIGIGAAGCWIGGAISDRWGRAPTAALMMAISGACALLIGLLHDGPTWLLLAVGSLWGFTVVADSAQFSTIVTELADQSYVGTALTLQLAIGFSLTVVTIWLIPALESAFTWRWAFAFLAPGPALGIIAMLRLHSVTSRAAAG